MPDTPPHAFQMSPSPFCLSAAGQGEWSEATRSTRPDSSSSQSASRVAASRIGGAPFSGGAGGGKTALPKAGKNGDLSAGVAKPLFGAPPPPPPPLRRRPL